MPKLAVYRDARRRFIYRIQAMPDISNLKVYPAEGIYSYAKIFGGKSEFKSTFRARKFYMDFFDMILKDMVDNGVIFVLPVPNFGYIHVAEMFQRKALGQVESVYFTDFYIRRKYQRQLGKKLIRIRMTKPYRKMLNKKIEAGQTY